MEDGNVQQLQLNPLTHNLQQQNFTGAFYCYVWSRQTLWQRISA